VHPSLINAIPERIRFSLDIRGVDEDSFREVAGAMAAFAEEAAARRGLRVEYERRQTLPATPLDDGIVGALEDAARETGEPYLPMPSGAAHDTMCVAERVPSAMVFVPCKDGISHSPLEAASPADAALAAEIILEAIRARLA
jgi:acetylornithine deacetylase/succinyl-diaminopimelate desuccinylase-like protein